MKRARRTGKGALEDFVYSNERVAFMYTRISGKVRVSRTCRKVISKPCSLYLCINHVSPPSSFYAYPLVFCNLTMQRSHVWYARCISPISLASGIKRLPFCKNVPPAQTHVTQKQQSIQIKPGTTPITPILYVSLLKQARPAHSPSSAPSAPQKPPY
jgi:hypothetical protein